MSHPAPRLLPDGSWVWSHRIPVHRLLRINIGRVPVLNEVLNDTSPCAGG
jgi:hypothetical protein